MIAQARRLLLVALLLVAPAAATHSPWPDARHGWEVRGDEEPGHAPYGLYSTEDGGRHWHLIYRADGDDIMSFLRTSASGGVISINYKAPEQYWTRDNGRHWYFTRRLPAFWQGGTNLAGKGHSLFWSRAHVLYQVTNWPPSERTEPRRRLAGRFRDGSFTDLAWIPGGVAGAVLRDPAKPTAPLARVLLGRPRKGYVVHLRDPDPARASRVTWLRLYASWPEVTVLGEDKLGDPVVVWSSFDGGRTWRISGRA